MTSSVTADDGSFNSDSLVAQGTFTHTFSQAGTFAHHCAIHTGMTGNVQVGVGGATEADEAEGDTGTSLVLPGVAALVVLGLGAGWLALRRR